MDQVWTSILQFLAQIVTPDWGSIIALLPLALIGLVVLYFVWVFIRFTKLGPTRRGKGRVRPKAPAGVHMPGPSLAPLLAGMGVALLFWSFVVGGNAILFGLLALVAALLYWGAEAIRDYDHLVGEHNALPARTFTGPPPGVHVPPPSARPLLIGLAMGVVFFGLVFGPALLVAGILMLIVVLLGWLRDARHEYRAVEEADVTGHLASGSAPPFPTGTLVAFAVLFGIAAAFNTGLIPPKTTVGESGAQQPPGSSAAPGTTGAAVGPSQQPQGDVTIVAEGIDFTTNNVTAPAGKAFTISFTNKDSGTPHNVDIHQGSPTGQSVWKGEVFPGVDTRVYQVPALPAGTYGFTCDVHPTMTGTITVK